jgi:hypothetical protein
MVAGCNNDELVSRCSVRAGRRYLFFMERGSLDLPSYEDRIGHEQYCVALRNPVAASCAQSATVGVENRLARPLVTFLLHNFPALVQPPQPSAMPSLEITQHCDHR